LGGKKRNELAKEMGFMDFFFLAFGIYGGVAWITTLGGWLQHGPVAAIWGFIICGIMLIPIGLAYAELTPAIPVAGGEVAFAYKAFGPFAATITGWFLSLAYIIVCPYEAISTSLVLEYIFPGLKSAALYTVGGYTIYLPTLIIGIVLSLLFTYINYKGVKFAKVFQTVASAIMAIMVLSFLFLSVKKGSVENMKPLFNPSETKFAAIFAVLGMAPFFLAGFDAIPQAAEEAKDGLAAKKIGNAILLAIFVGIAFYTLTTVAVALTNPWQDTVEQSLPTLYAFENAFSGGVRNTVMFCALLGLLTTWNGCFIAGTRVLFALGRGGLIPKAFGKVHPEYKTPYVAVIFTGIITLIGPFVGKSGLIPAVDVGALAFVIAWLAVSLSVIKLRKTHPDMERPYKMPGGIGTGILAVIVCIFVLGLMLVPGAPSALAWPTEWIVLGVWIVLGLLFYFFVTKKDAKNMTLEEQKYQILGKY